MHYQVKQVSSSIEATQFTAEMAQAYMAWHMADENSRDKPPALPPHTTYTEGGGFVLETVEGGVRLVYGDYVTDVNGRVERVAAADFEARWEAGAMPKRVDLGTGDLRFDKDGRLTDGGKLEEVVKHMAPAKLAPEPEASWPSAAHTEQERRAKVEAAELAAPLKHTPAHQDDEPPVHRTKHKGKP